MMNERTYFSCVRFALRVFGFCVKCLPYLVLCCAVLWRGRGGEEGEERRWKGGARLSSNNRKF